MFDWFLTNGLNLEDVTIKQKFECNKSEWLRPFIAFNGMKRVEAKANKIKFDGVFFKLMNSAFYGKTNEIDKMWS